jgi:dolichol kinase
VIHFSTVLIPLLYIYLLNREQILLLCGILSIGFLLADLFRFKFREVKKVFLKVFGSLLKDEERNRKLTGATHLFLSATIVIYLFEKNSTIPALCILSVADAAAAVSGNLLGTHRLSHKTWEGSLIFFFVTFFIIIVLTDLKALVILLISGLITLIEVLPIPINDNYTVAIGSAFIFSQLL